MDPLASQNTPVRLGPYTLLRKLGEGGMGEVHLANDTRLARKVALKLLPPGLRSDPERRTRFLREARAAAQLSHPNVAQIFDVGEEHGLDYIAFELIEGRTLEELLAEGPLALAQVVEIALPLADALSYAHERGVVHRDLKAANVMVTSRAHPKLLDFGLAKLLQEETRAPGGKSTTLTVAGAIFGTPAAMSPEQALGRSLDARSDVFSFGSLLYEMASGRPAFTGATLMEVMDAVIHREPPLLARVRPELPEEFAAIVAKALRKDPAERYQTMSDLAADLRHWKRQTDSGLLPPARSRRTPHRGLVLAAIALLAAAGAAYWKWGRSAGPGAAGESGARPAELVAVMGFENLSDPGDKDATCRMLMSLVATDLAEHGGLRVVSIAKVLASLEEVRGSAGGRFETATAVRAARVAGASVMLTGQLLRSESGLILTAELADVASGEARGSLHEQAPSAEKVFALAGAVGSAVRSRLGIADAPRALDLQRWLTGSPAAYREYNAGELAMHRREFAVARSFFQRAVELDPSFSMAFFRLGMVRDWLDEPDACASYDQALEHVERLNERWRVVCRAAADRCRGDARAAFDALEPLIAAGTDIPEAWNELGEVLQHEDEFRDPERGLLCFTRALDLDPTFEVVSYHLVNMTLAADDLPAARALVKRISRSTTPGYGAVALLLAQGHFAEAVAEAERRLASGTLTEWDEYAAAARKLRQPAVAARALEAWRRATTTPTEWQGLSQSGLDFAEGRFGDAIAAATHVAASPARAAGSSPLMTVAEYQLWSGDLPGADATIRAALELAPLSPHVWLLLGMIQLAAGRAPDAARTLADMRATMQRTRNTTWPSLADLLQALVASAEGSHAEARAALERSRAHPPACRNRRFENLFAARLAEAAGDLPGARASWLLVLRPDYLTSLDDGMSWRDLEIPALYELGRLEHLLGNHEAARGHLEEFLACWGNADRPLASVEDARQRLAQLDAR